MRAHLEYFKVRGDPFQGNCCCICCVIYVVLDVTRCNLLNLDLGQALVNPFAAEIGYAAWRDARYLFLGGDGQ